MSGAKTAPQAQATHEQARTVNLDDVMQATEDMRAVLGKRWGVAPSNVMRYGESFISLARNCPVDFHLNGAIITQFLSICKEHDLNPARYEVRAFYDYDKGLSTFVMIDGWLTLANRNPDYDGCDFEYEFDDQGKMQAVTCLIYRKNRSRATKARVKLSEWYVATSPQWRMKPEWMLEQKALKQAIRRAFGFAGIMDDDDARQMGLGIFEDQDKPGDKKIDAGEGIKLSSLKPGEAPPEDEYSRPAAGDTDGDSGEVPDDGPDEPDQSSVGQPEVPVTPAATDHEAGSGPAPEDGPPDSDSEPASKSSKGKKKKGKKKKPKEDDAPTLLEILRINLAEAGVSFEQAGEAMGMTDVELEGQAKKGVPFTLGDFSALEGLGVTVHELRAWQKKHA